MNLALHHPWVLLFAPLILIPLFRSAGEQVSYAWTELLPADPMSRLIDWLVRLLGALAIAALLLTLAGLHRTEQPFQRISRGAEIVILLDRSRSMDQRLVSRRNTQDWLDARNKRKGQVSKELLSEFVAQRSEDRFAFLLFSTRTMEISKFTRQHAMIQAAINASQTGRGIADTELGLAVSHGLELFASRPFVGSRAMILVSDGGARLDGFTKQRLKKLLDQTRVGIYWIYLRSTKSPGLLSGKQLTKEEAETVPEYLLNKFFEESAAFYKAYQADSPDEMRKAIEDISRLENRPIRYQEVRPVVNLDAYTLMVAAISLGLLLLILALSLLGSGASSNAVTASRSVRS